MTALLALTLLLAAAPAPAAPALKPDNSAAQYLSPAELAAVARAVTEPAIYVTRWTGALMRAKVRLIQQLRERFPGRTLPDTALLRVNMRVMLRLNNRWLESLNGRRIYPGQEDFDRFAAAAAAELGRYYASLPPDHKWGDRDHNAAQDILDRELRRGVNRLPVYRGRGWPPEPPPSAEENAYLNQ